jgi:Tol biopolymer transport system component
MTGELRELGAMGNGTPDVPQAAPDVKVPLAVEWSPDGSRIAFGAGMSPPYTLTVADVHANMSVRTEFVEGYAGEVRWSPDGSQVAVSTYSEDRSRHESYLVDPATGVATHLVAGCVIIWSPDGAFLAIHAEQDDRIVIVDAVTREVTPLGVRGYPLTWTE